MKKKKAGRVLLSFLLSLVLVIGFMPGMSMTAHAEPTEELLTTITGTGTNGAATSENISYSTGGVATLTFSGEVLYVSDWGWWGYDITLTVTPADGYTITKCVFYDNKDNNATDSEAPFVVETTSDQKMPKVNGDYIYPYSDSAGVKKIEVYGYANPTTVDITGVSLNKNSTTLTVGGTETLTATVSPDDASDKSVTWSSSDTTVATVENGVVTAVGSGTANITVTATNGTDDASDDMTATCAVTVNAATVKSSVTLNANGGTVNSGNITEYTEGTGATLPTDVTKDGHQFGGWYDNAGLTGSPVTAISTSDTGNKEYWAKWTANPSAVSYSVVFKVVNGSWDDGNTSDKSVTLSGVEGDTLKLSSGQIPAVGTKPNDGYKAGSWDVTPSTDTAISSNVTYTYTYVADSSGGASDSGSGDSSGGSSDSGSSDSSGETSGGSSDNTNTNTDTSTKVPYDDVAISTGSVNDITGTAAATAESNPFGTKIENSSNLTTLLSLTDAEVAQGVNVWLDIQDMSSSVSKTDKSLIQDKSGDYTVGLYLDINLFKKVGSNDATKVTETKGKVKASIVIPESLWKSGRIFEIIRVHDGVATAIAGTYDENTHVFTFETDKFSTYALAYKDPASSSDSGTTSDSSSSNSSNSTESTAPKTGDPNDIRVWYLLLIASLGGLGFLGYSKKKKVND